MADRRRTLGHARLYLVCDALTDAVVAAALRGGVDIVQLRVKHGGDDTILSTARRYRSLCDAAGALLIVNDRPDLAVRADADGVHVGQDDVAVTEARRIVGPDRLVGLSTHTPGQIDAAVRDPEIDYIGVGPVHQTPTKPGRMAVGLELVRYARDQGGQPFFAIGGISAENVLPVCQAGAQRVAVVRAIAAAPDPEQAAADLRAALGAPTRDEAEVGAAH
jgi:thiamine-phosphate pyrophosphorylase